MKRAFHFCVEYQEGPGQFHVFDGVITTEKDPFCKNFYEEVKASIVEAMTPPRNSDKVTMRSLTLLAESSNAKGQAREASHAPTGCASNVTTENNLQKNGSNAAGERDGL